MKKVLVLFLIIAGIYIGFMNLHRITWLPFSEQSNQAVVNQHIDKMDMDLSGISTAIIPEDRNNVQADLNGKGTVTVTKSGNSLSVKYTRKWFDWMSIFDHPKLTIYIPKDYDNDLEIKMNAGTLLYEGKNTTLDHFTLDMGAGNIHINNLTVNQLKHDGSSGNLIFNKYTQRLDPLILVQEILI